MSEPGEPEATTNRSLLWGRDLTRMFFVVFWNNRKLICWNLAVGVKKIPNLSMKNYTPFHSFSLIKRVKYEMISPFSRNEKWKIFSLHSFREVKVKIKWLKIEIEKWKWKSNDSKSRSRSEFSKKFSRILENRDSRWSLAQKTHHPPAGTGYPQSVGQCKQIHLAWKSAQCFHNVLPTVSSIIGFAKEILIGLL